jgi:beta-glucuronidase
MDSSRLVTYACNRGIKDKFLEQLDVICYNTYPGWYAHDHEAEYPQEEIVPCVRKLMSELEDRGLKDKPFILSEIGAGAIYGWHDQLNNYWTEDYQSECLDRICREVVDNDDITGVALWQFCDCRTYRGFRALGRPRAFNNKGTLDEYRRPKKAYWTVKDIFTKYKG